MTSMTITTPRVTIHAPGPKYVPARRDPHGDLIDPGVQDIVQHPPGTHVTLDADEAERILARFGGDEVHPTTGEVLRTVTPPLNGGPAAGSR